jgi:hypothetical protein
VPEGFVVAPHFRGYAHLGIGAYVINHSAKGEPAELAISIATEEEKAGRTVGDTRDNAPDAMVQPESMAVRLRFENVAGLDALEKQLAFVRSEHFHESIVTSAGAQNAEAIRNQETELDGLRSVICAIGIVGKIDGHDVIRRTSVLDLIDRSRAAVKGALQTGSANTQEGGASAERSGE